MCFFSDARPAAVILNGLPFINFDAVLSTPEQVCKTLSLLLETNLRYRREILSVDFQVTKRRSFRIRPRRLLRGRLQENTFQRSSKSNSGGFPTLIILCRTLELANFLFNKGRATAMKIEHYVEDAVIRQKIRTADLAACVMEMFGHEELQVIYNPFAQESVLLKTGPTWHGIKYAYGKFRFHELPLDQPICPPPLPYEYSGEHVTDTTVENINGYDEVDDPSLASQV